MDVNATMQQAYTILQACVILELYVVTQEGAMQPCARVWMHKHVYLHVCKDGYVHPLKTCGPWKYDKRQPISPRFSRGICCQRKLSLLVDVSSNPRQHGFISPIFAMSSGLARVQSRSWWSCTAVASLRRKLSEQVCD